MLAREKAPSVLLIRTALLFGVLLFGAVTWYVRRGGSPDTLAPDATTRLGYVFMGLAAAVVGLLFVLRQRVASEKNPQKQVPMYLAGYASAEGAALFGGAIWYLGGVYEWYIAGLVLMVVSFQLLPIARRAS